MWHYSSKPLDFKFLVLGIGILELKQFIVFYPLYYGSSKFFLLFMLLSLILCVSLSVSSLCPKLVCDIWKTIQSYKWYSGYNRSENCSRSWRPLNSLKGALFLNYVAKDRRLQLASNSFQRTQWFWNVSSVLLVGNIQSIGKQLAYKNAEIPTTHFICSGFQKWMRILIQN